MLGTVFTAIGMDRLYLSGFFALLRAAIALVRPILFQLLIESLVNPESSQQERWLLSSSLLVIPVVAAIVNNAHDKIINRVGMHSRTMLSSALYRKAMRVNMASTGSNTGQVQNLMSQDTGATMMMVYQIHELWIAPITVGVGLYLLYGLVQGAAFAGVGVIVLSAPVTAVVFSKLHRLFQEKLTFMDKRIKLINELVSGIRTVRGQPPLVRRLAAR